MNSPVYLLKLELSGIKNIEKKIVIDFYKKTIANDFDPEDYRVKGIYGENGSGKTAIVTAVSILRKLILDNHYLSDSDTQKKLTEIINKKTRSCQMAVELYYQLGEKAIINRYEVSLRIENDFWVVIDHEQLFRKVGTYSKNNFNLVYRIKNGEISDIVIDIDDKDYVIDKTLNLLRQQTFVSTILQIYKGFNSVSNIFADLAFMLIFAVSVTVYIDDVDDHSGYFLAKKVREVSTSAREKMRFDERKYVEDFYSLRSNEKSVPKKEFEAYKNKISRLCEFIKIFKSELLDIEIDKREDKEFYICNLIMVYKDYKLDKEFESKGIKKLMDMFDYLDMASRGFIVFIDELDSNVNDVYLDKLIEYMMYYGKGQLCFTAHNLSPMSVLKQNKASITFISSINTIHTWTNKGNLIPENAYRNGFIEDSPFNVQASDFIGVLGGDDA